MVGTYKICVSHRSEGGFASMNSFSMVAGSAEDACSGLANYLLPTDRVDIYRRDTTFVGPVDGHWSDNFTLTNRGTIFTDHTGTHLVLHDIVSRVESVVPLSVVA